MNVLARGLLPVRLGLGSDYTPATIHDLARYHLTPSGGNTKIELGECQQSDVAGSVSLGKSWALDLN